MLLDAGADQGYVFFTMDVAQGLNFDAYVSVGSTLRERVRRAATAGAGVASALSGIHRLGLSHRDVKPANIVVDGEDRAVILDFGTARFGGSHDTHGRLAGTVAYMAPEQRLGMAHDEAVASIAGDEKGLSGEIAFRLYDT